MENNKTCFGKTKKSITNEPCFNINRTDINDATIIANSFNDYFVSIGSKLADEIDKSNLSD